MTKAEQDTVIEALRKNVLTATKCAVRLIAGNGAVTVAGTLESIQIKDTIKAVVTVRKNAENLPELYDAAGQEVLVVCSGNAVYAKTWIWCRARTISAASNLAPNTTRTGRLTTSVKPASWMWSPAGSRARGSKGGSL